VSESDWWKRGVIYQIYPRSFADSNGDGIGDLPGIIEKLDYLADLGVDAIWLSPIHPSPMADFGYDVSDYRGIDPVFGTLADFDRLVGEARRRGIRVVMDLVLNHTSDRHRWFLESRSSRDNPRRNWYIWRDGRGGGPPNNWMASFGGGAWEWDAPTGQYYLHSFMREQPDVNWRNAELKEAMFAAVRFWLDRGVAGFRLDVINWLIKDEMLRSNPFGFGPTPRPYDLQKHLFDRNRPETHPIIRELRALVDSAGERMLVGEVYSEPPGDPALSASYLGQGDELHLAFDFSLLFSKWSAARFFRSVDRWAQALPPGGWPCHVLSNHDQRRSAGRLARGSRSEADARARVAAVLLLTLRGTPFLYYGEELGMRDGRIRRSEIVDPIGKRYWPLNRGRDAERTPMPWTDAENAGFTSGRPWLPVDPEHRKSNVELQARDPASLLNFYKRLIALRRERRALTAGEWIPAATGKRGVIAYYRVAGDERLFVALNFVRSPRKVALEAPGDWRVLCSSRRAAGETQSGLALSLGPYEATIWEGR